LLFNHPNIYSSNIPTWAKGKFEVFKKASEEIHIRDPPYFNTAQIRSLDGVSFTRYILGHLKSLKLVPFNWVFQLCKVHEIPKGFIC
jgi:hypothetical protein